MAKTKKKPALYPGEDGAERERERARLAFVPEEETERERLERLGFSPERVLVWLNID